MPDLSRPPPRETHVLPSRLTERVQAEYREMPGLSLTLPQACRLLALGPSSCSAVLEALVDTGVLFRTSNGVYRRN